MSILDRIWAFPLDVSWFHFPCFLAAASPPLLALCCHKAAMDSED